MDDPAKGTLGMHLLDDADYVGFRRSVRPEHPHRTTRGSDKIDYTRCLRFVGTEAGNKRKVSCAAFDHEAGQTTAETPEAPNEKVANVR